MREPQGGPRGSEGDAREGPSHSPLRPVRWLLAIALLLLAIAAVGVATLLIDPDRYKGAIESAVQRETGRPLVLEGHLRLAWFPWLGVRTGAARLGHPAGAVGPDLLDWQSAAVRVRLLPLLLHRRLEVARIEITGADIHLRRAADGAGNWDDLIARFSAGHQTPRAASTPPAAPAPPTTWAGLDLIDSSLQYDDERSHEQVTLTGWRLDVGPWRAGAPLSVSTRFLLHVRTLQPSASRAGSGVGFNGGGSSSGGAGNGRVSGEGGSALQLPAAGVRVAVDVPRLQIRATPLEVEAPHWSLDVAESKLQGTLEARREAGGPVSAGGSLQAAVPSVRSLGRALGIALPTLHDPAALGALSLSGSWRWQHGGLSVQPLSAKLDDTTLTGWIAHSGGPRATWTFALRADQIDFGRYLTRPARPQQPVSLPVSSLRALRARGTLELERATLNGTTLRNVRLKVQ